MPCKDSSSQVTVVLASDETVRDFDFSKITCRKEIGGSTGYKDLCVGRRIEEIGGWEFSPLVQRLGLTEPDDQFFLYLEWEALRTAIAQYLGQEEKIDRDRYQLASILHDGTTIEIRQVIRPVPEMPKIIPCSKRAAASSNQSEKSRTGRT